MKKTTVEQAVAAIQAADTNSAIWTVLMQCTKYDMVDVYAEITRQGHKFNMSQKKEHIASTIVSLIMDWRKDAEFKAKSLTEKIEFVKACTPYKAGSYLCKCTDDEVLAIASELGVPERYAQKANRKYFVIDDIVHALRAMVTEQRISGLLAMDDKIGVKEELKDASTMTLNLLVKMAGLDIDCEASDVSRKVKEEALYKYYAEKAQEVPAAVEAQSAVTYSDVDDAYFAFEAESKRCCTAGEDASAVVEGQSEQPAVVAQCKANEVATMTKWEKKQCAKARAKANRFFRTMSNRQIVFALELYREAMAWAETHDFSSIYTNPTTRNKVEEWVSSYEVQEAKGLYDGWIDYLDHYSRMLNVKIKGHSGFDEPTNCDEEDSLVQSITDRVALIGSDPRAIECEKAYHEELEAEHQAAMKRIERYIQAANGGLIEYTDDLGWEIIHSCRNCEDKKAIRNAIAEYNCEVLSQYRTREELTAAIKRAIPMTIAQTLYLLTGKQIDGNRELDTRSITKFLDWYIASEYYHPEVHAKHAQSVVTYADVDDAYFAFEAEEERCCTAGEDADFTLCNKLEREYLRLLAAYRQTDMPEGQEVLKFIRENYHDDCELARKSSCELNEMAMKCGINGHSYSHSRELVKDLARTANIPVLSDWTSLTIYQKRKQLQECLHYTWQLRHGMKKLKKLHQAGTISNEDYQAICFVCDWELRPAKNSPFLEYYKEVCRVYGEVKKRELRRAG